MLASRRPSTNPQGLVSTGAHVASEGLQGLLKLAHDALHSNFPKAVRGDQCRTKEGCCPEPCKPPLLKLDADGRHYGTKQGSDARRHKHPVIVKRTRSNADLHRAALHCGLSVRATSVAAAISASSVRSSV